MESENNSHLPADTAGSIYTADTFLNDFTGPAKAATAQETPVQTEEQIRQETAAQEQLQAAETVATPIFSAEEQIEQEPLKIKKWTKTEMTASLEMFMNFRDMLQSKLLAWYAKSGDASKYELDEDQLNHLARVYAPYFEKFGNNIPDWIWILLAEGMIMFPLITEARKERTTNSSNSRLATSTPIQEAVKNVVAIPTTRKKFAINTSGYYINPPTSSLYLKKHEQTEKASLTDIEGLLRDNDITIIAKAFPGIDLSKYEGQAM